MPGAGQSPGNDHEGVIKLWARRCRAAVAGVLKALLAAVDQPAVDRLARFLIDWLGGSDPRLQRTAAQVHTSPPMKLWILVGAMLGLKRALNSGLPQQLRRARSAIIHRPYAARLILLKRCRCGFAAAGIRDRAA